MLSQVYIALVWLPVPIFFFIAEGDEQKLEEFCHHGKELVVEIEVEIIVEFLIGSFSKGSDNILNRFSDEAFNFSLFFGDLCVQFCVCHQMDEQMGDLIDEFKGFFVLEHNLSTISFSSIPISVSIFIVRLATENLKVGIFDMLVQF